MNRNIYKEFYKAYLEKGMSVVPDKYGGKGYAFKGLNVHLGKLPTEKEAEEYANKLEESNIALCTGSVSGIIALDFDATDPDIIAAIEPLLPTSPVEKVGSKGFTRFFRYNGEQSYSVKDHKGEIVFEVLSDNKKTTLPPSRHPNGSDYVWTKGDLLNIDLNELPLLPPYLEKQMDMFIKTEFGVADTGIKTINGRNAALSSYLGTLLNDNPTADEAIKSLIQYDAEHNETPYFTDPSEHRHTSAYTNALSFYTSHLESINARNFRDNKEYVEPVMQAVEDLEKLKERARKKSIAVGEARNFQKDVIEFIPASTAIKSIYETMIKNSWIPQPQMALGATLSLMSTLMSRKFTFQGLSPNLYVLNVAPSGAGKNHPLEMVKETLVKSGAKYLIGASDIVSNAGITDSLPLRPTAIFFLDEASEKIKKSTSGNADYNAGLDALLCELYTSSNSYYAGRSLAAFNGVPQVRGAVDRPNIILLGATTPTALRTCLDSTSLDKGLIGRFLIFEGDSKTPSKRVHEKTELPSAIVEHLSFLAKYEYANVEENAMQERPKEVAEVNVTQEANAALDLVFSEFDALRLSKIGTPVAAIAARLYTSVIKICILSAGGRPFKDVPTIEVEDVHFARALVKDYYERLDNIASKYIVDTRLEADKVKVLDIIQSKGVVDKKVLARLTPQFSKRQRDALLEDLLETELIRACISRDVETGKNNVEYIYNE